MGLNFRNFNLIALRIPLLQSLHWLVHYTFRKMGYQWELRRKGELKIGLWRQNFRPSKDLKNDLPNETGKLYPKRFVLIPGFGDTPLSWYAVIALLLPLLKREFDEIILFDLPGFSGFLSREKCFHSMDAMREMVAEVLDELKPHTLLGHSLGGWLVSYYAGAWGAGLRPPVKNLDYRGPAQIILADPSGVFDQDSSKLEWEEKFRRAMDEGFHILRPHVFFKEPIWFKYVMSEFAAFILKEDVQVFARSVREDHSVEKLIPQIRAKTWILWGDQDSLCPTQWVHTWLRLFSFSQAQAKAVLIKNAGHSIQIEAPGKTATVLAQILSAKIPHRLGKRWYRVLHAPEIKALT